MNMRRALLPQDLFQTKDEGFQLVFEGDDLPILQAHLVVAKNPSKMSVPEVN
jgi:hypothetical protein